MNKDNLKIGIISTHRQTNWGSVLQCYALQKALANQGFVAEYIDYYPDDVTVEGRLRTLKGKSRYFKNPLAYAIAKYVFGISYRNNKKVFDRFIIKHLVLSCNTYYSPEEVEKGLPKEDIYCLGGDQVLFGFKALDVFDRIDETHIKVTYSSSFGKTSFNDDEWNREKNILRKFDALSCREDSGVEIMKKMGLNNTQQIIDPVFLLDQEEWRKSFKGHPQVDKYIFVYNLHHDKNLEKLEKYLSKELGLKVINVCNHWFEVYRFGKCIWCPPVEDFLELIEGAELVISDSFHATAFAILFNKKFLTVVPELVGTRLDSVTRLFGVENHLIRTKNLKKSLEEANTKIDYGKINHIIENERKRAFEYIQSWKELVKE